MLVRARNALFPRDTRRGRLVRAPLGKAAHGDLEGAWDDYVQTHPTAYFVQIGSNDGTFHDPIDDAIERRSGWKGMFVEPVPEYFEALARRRGDEDRFTLVRAAVTEHDAPTISMLSVQPSADLPHWTHQLSSLHPEVLLKNARFVPEVREHLVTIEVPALTFEELVADVQSIDVVHIDTEGHDAMILDQIDLERWHPDLVLFEHRNLSLREWHRVKRRLRTSGYRIAWDDCDTLASRSKRPQPT